MAASTITPDTWTNDTGSAAAPNGDGTVLNNSVLQNHIYARINAMFAGAGSYATLTLGGLLAAEGFGSFTFSAGGTGGNQFLIRNTSAGTGNYAGILFGNDGSSSAGVLTVQSSTYTTSAFNVQDGMTLAHTRAGGISIATQHASGLIRFYTASGSERMRITSGGQVLVGHTSNGEITAGGVGILNSDQSIALALKGSLSDVTHGITVVTVETNTFGAFKQEASGGGLHIAGFRENGSGRRAILLSGYLGDTGDTTKSTAAVGAVQIRGGSNFAASMSANENILAVDDGLNTRFILDADGDSHQDVGTAWTNFDDHDDIALLHALSAGVSRPGDPLRRTFGRFLREHRDTLSRNRIVTFNKNGHHFINWSRAHMLTIGAVRQIGMQQQDLEERIEALERKVA
jgi:hypothetical protein